MTARSDRTALDTTSRKCFVDKDIRDILAPIYYRHEFARRNEGVANASADLLRHFPLTAALTDGGGFIRLECGEYHTLVDDLLHEYETLRGETKAATIQALKNFAKNNAILPVLPPPQPFFPESMGVHRELLLKVSPAGKKSGPAAFTPKQRKELIAILRSLFRYEEFLLAEGAEKPCFMPVVRIPRLRDKEKVPSSISLETFRELSRERLMIAFDISERRNVLENLFHILLEFDEVLPVRNPEESASRRERNIHFLTLERSLLIHDYEQKAGKRLSEYQKAAIAYPMLKGGKPIAPTSKDKRINRAVAEYRSLRSLASHNIENYKEIG
jgi:hypothetical protein